MKKRWYLIVGTGIMLLAVAFLLVQTKNKNVQKQTPVAGSSVKVADSISKPVIDFESLLIHKLQKLVKEGSHGLYDLSLKNVQVNVLQSTVVITDAMLIPNAKALSVLDQAGKAPDNVFKISLRSLHINNLNIKDLLFNKTVDLASLYISHPVVEVYHKSRVYNKAKRADTPTLYQRWTEDMKSIGIKKISIEHSTYINYNLDRKNKITRFNDVSMNFSDLLVDSTTQFDKSRFLFTKDAVLTFKNYILKTPDSLYLFKMGTVAVSAVKHTIAATDVSLQPRYSKEAFQKKVKVSTERYNLAIPNMLFKNIDWWHITNEQDFTADELTISDALLQTYLDRSLPPSTPEYQNFPHQLLLKLPLPVHIKKIAVRNLNIAYEEYSRTSGKTGTLYFSNINGTINNATNIKEQIRHNPFATIAATGMIMKRIPVKANFKLDLSNPKKGNFSTDIQMEGFDGPSLNNITEPMGIFSIKRGVVKKATAHIEGDDYASRGNVLIVYNDLHIVPLKKDNSAGGFKKKSLVSFLANTLIIKNDNPGKNEAPRNPEITLKRDPIGSFFNLIWKTILAGALKTIGAPEKLAQ